MFAFEVADVASLRFDADLGRLLIPETLAEQYTELPRTGQVSGTSLATPRAIAESELD